MTRDVSQDRFDEQTLVEAARHDVEAFATLYRRYVDRIYAYAYRRTGSVSTAEDITSATFEKALRGLDRYRWREPGIGPWLFRIAANELTDTHRRRQRQDRIAHRLHSVSATNPDDPGLDALRHIETNGELRDALDAISIRYQRVLSLRYLADLSNEEAALAMGVTRSTMAVLVHRASAALRRALERQQTEGAHHAG